MSFALPRTASSRRPSTDAAAVAARWLLWSTLTVATLGFGASVAWAGMPGEGMNRMNGVNGTGDPSGAPAAGAVMPRPAGSVPAGVASRSAGGSLDRHLTPRRLPRSAVLQPARRGGSGAPEVLCACVRHAPQG